MADLVVIVPTRGRPARFREMAEAALSLAEGDVEILACVDDDDPARDDYLAVQYRRMDGPRKTLSAWSNVGADHVLDDPEPPTYLASLGDDHRPRTRGWDTKLMAAAEKVGGWAYGNDLLAGPSLPTAWVVKSEIVRTLGWLMLPACDHLYVDNAVLELGRRTNRIAYVPSVIVEHEHPLAGRTDWDESYRETNAAERYAADKSAFDAWANGHGLDEDIARIGVRW